MSGDRPETFTTALRAMADWMDTADEAIDLVCRIRQVRNPTKGDAVQRDLRKLADALDKRPVTRRLLDQLWQRIEEQP